MYNKKKHDKEEEIKRVRSTGNIQSLHNLERMSPIEEFDNNNDIVIEDYELE